MYLMDIDTYECDFCGTQIKWGEKEEEHGDMWGCERCERHFCEKCFTDRYGRDRFQEMLQERNDVLCPDCYSKEIRTSGTPEQKFEIFTDDLVPGEGAAATVAGEILRAANRIIYRYENDGDILGYGSGRYECNAPGRYLSAHAGEKVAAILQKMWRCTNTNHYESFLTRFRDAILGHLEAHPELEVTLNKEDMWSWRKPEDLDCDEDEDR